MHLDELNKTNQELLRDYLNDMEIGKNISISSKKGSRSYGRLRNQKAKLYSLFRLIQEEFNNKKINKLSEDEVLNFFDKMRKGLIKSPRTNKPYNAVGTYVKSFKAFWHWFIKKSKKDKNIIEDITLDLDSKDEKPSFNYVTIDQVKQLCDNVKIYYKVLMMFLFDSGIRAPTELMNVKVSDLTYNDKDKWYNLNIREETSKTFGRKIKLLLCSDILKQYIEQNKLKNNNYLFTKTPQKTNAYISRYGLNILSIGNAVKKKVKDRYVLKWVKKGLSMYDFRHSSACYWISKYKNESSIKYRFGWKKSDMIYYYYTEFLGLKDTIQREDLYVDISKTELEKQIADIKKQQAIKEEVQQKQIEDMQKQLKEMKKFEQFTEQEQEELREIGIKPKINNFEKIS